MIQIVSGDEFKRRISAPLYPDTVLRERVSKIISSVRDSGDDALIQFALEFDKVRLERIRVPDEEFRKAESLLDSSIRVILEEAIRNIREFHGHQPFKSWQVKHDDGTVLGESVTPLDRVGIYIPGGKAFYPSTLIMNVIPAQIAGVPSIAVVTPPGDDGLPHTLILAVCSILHINEVYSTGGAQAIAALAYGTKTITPVCKITGPGNRFVAEAKRQVFGAVGIDSLAGPSEILILHDDPEIPVEYLVRDLLTQAEHDENASAVLLTVFPEVANRVRRRLVELVPTLPRNEIIQSSLKNKGKIVVIDSVDQGVEIVNSMAPEHLEFLVKDPNKRSQIKNAGAIFIGQWSTETVGDYFAGPNHTIPTGKSARYGSPLSVRDFQKHTSLIEYSRERLLRQAKAIINFAEMESLHSHAAAIRERTYLDKL